jgi:NTP pyrophosphatase (non-canonical NTP hydrolase)
MNKIQSIAHSYRAAILAGQHEAMCKASMSAVTQYCHGASYASGWWNNPKTGELLEVTKDAIGMKLCLIHSEVSEALEGFRTNEQDKHLPHRSSLEVELADAIIRICDLAGALDLDLGGAMAEKLAYNQSRADHKPENRAKDGGKAF